MQDKEIQTIQPSIQTLGNPEAFTNIAKMVQKHVNDNKLSANIQGKNYPLVEAWQFTGALIGILATVTEVEDLCTDTELKYRAVVELRDANNIVRSRAEAVCSNKEKSKKWFDDYAIQSMAQTRAVGKAYRIAFGWIMKAAGFEATPSEEMPEIEKEDTDKVSYLLEQKKALEAQVKKLTNEKNKLTREYKEAVIYAIDNACQLETIKDLKAKCKSFTGKKWNDYVNSAIDKLDDDPKSNDHGLNKDEL